MAEGRRVFDGTFFALLAALALLAAFGYARGGAELVRAGLGDGAGQLIRREWRLATFEHGFDLRVADAVERDLGAVPGCDFGLGARIEGERLRARLVARVA